MKRPRLCKRYCNALRLFGCSGPLCPSCDSCETWLQFWERVFTTPPPS
jgi:hypothetical protein